MLISRTEGIKRLNQFIATALSDYGQRRNLDLGPESHQGVVSVLSPYLCNRLILESECIAAALKAHPAPTISKWVDEVIWRTYWRGWLEHHPSVWLDYKASLNSLKEAGWHSRNDYLGALEGRSGIKCFDAWVKELKDTGYLHNHARMWLASIWIFTLRLPWQLGAEFFLKHLLDGDPAVNTLSWRWVAGLHTKGKRYLATAENINVCTQGRYVVTEHLATPEEADKIVHLSAEPAEAGIPGEYDIIKPSIRPDAQATLLIHPEDLSLEFSELAEHNFQKLLAVDPNRVAAISWLDAKVLNHHKAAIADGVRRAEQHFKLPAQWVSPEEIGDGALGVSKDLYFMRPASPLWRDILMPHLGGCLAVPVTRPWDKSLYPFATGGFFQFKEKAWRADLW